MGYSNWSNHAYKKRQDYRKKTNTSAFTYDKHVRSSGVVQIHDEMNPFGVNRESRDSADHPDSVAIAVLFDVTGSMGSIPRVLQKKLGALMRLLVQKGYVAHPQILFGAIGDAYSDRVPLQIGQFESGLEMDDDLGKIYIEGAGGGQVRETYELGMYFMARHTTIDCYEKRGKKGYLITIGDEMPYSAVQASQVRQHIGDELQKSIPIKKMVAEVNEKYNHFHIIPTNTYHGKSAKVQARWRDLLGERLILLDDAESVCETIGLAIGLCEGIVDDLDDAVDDLVDAGYATQDVNRAAGALTLYAAQRPLVIPTATATGTVMLPAAT